MKKVKKIKITDFAVFDAVDYLKTDKDMADYLNAVLDDGDPALFIAAIGDIAKAKGMMEISKKSGVTREALYRALKLGSQPRFETVAKVINALGMRLTVQS
jgi:probable addiction module antidote protein